jgi:hypothetical protein
MRLTVPLLLAGCSATVSAPPSGQITSDKPHLTTDQQQQRYVQIRDTARGVGVGTAYLLAGISNDETGLAMCWSEATYACQGPSSPDCGGGPVIAGAADGPCDEDQGGLGMFQFDAGTYQDTLNQYGPSVLTIDGQIHDAIAYAVNMVEESDFTTNAETDQQALQWIADFDPSNATLVDQWISTVVEYYNGCQPGDDCWDARYQTYSQGYQDAISAPGGLGFWATDGGVRCGNTPAAVGAIEAHYVALGACASVVGAPTQAETGTPDGIGRYSVFAQGSIYWTAQTGAFEVHGAIRDEWAAVGWEAGILGYPLSDETGTPDGVGRYNVFQHGSIYWTPATGAHEVDGAIRAAWASVGWEAGELGYPISDGYAVTGGRRNDFQHGSITWSASTNTTTITQD